MNTALVWILGIATFVAAVAWFAYAFWKGRPPAIGLFFFRAIVKFLFKAPETLSAFGLLEKFGIKGHNRRWSKGTMKDALELVDGVKTELTFLRSWDRSRLPPAKALSAEILDWFLEDNVQGGAYLAQSFPVTQMFGLHTQMPDFMQNTHPVDGMANAINYAIRLEKFPEQFAMAISYMEEARGKGCVPPRFALEKAIGQMREIVSPLPKDNPMCKVFAEKLEKLKLSEKAKRTLLARAEKALADKVYPAYGNLIAFCEKLLESADSNDGAWRLPDGAAYYRASLKSATTLDDDPESIHRTGVEESARIEREISALLDRLGVATGATVGERVAALNKDERFFYPAGEEGRKAALADYRAILAGMETRLPDFFERLPKAKVEIEPVPAAQEKDGPGGYYQMGDLGGKRPGRFFVNLYDPKKNPKYAMKSLCYHETIPGHHLQLSLGLEMKGAPLFRKMLPFTSYMEGWALYAERLAWEKGFYEGDPLGELGYFLSEQFRAVRLVVDTGLHAMKWSREKAIAYMLEHTGDENVAEVERYIVMPGQACAYKVGELAIRTMREKAEKELGPKFDLGRFHSAILDRGAMPLDILRRLVDEWIAEEKAKA